MCIRSQTRGPRTSPSVSAESDPQFGGSGKYRTTRIGTTLYFSSESELMDLVSPYFTIRKLKTMDVSSKFGPHRAVCVLATRH